MAKKNQSYSEAFDELQAILEKLEQDEPDVDVLTKSVKRAAELIRFCKSKLHDTEAEVEKIISEMDDEG